MDDQQNAALVLVGHGSTVNADSSLPLKRLVDAFQHRGSFARVKAGFWKAQPPLSEVLEDVTDERVFVLPFFISDGYFTRQVVPRELGFRRAGQRSFDRVMKRGDQTLFYCSPVGTHDRMTDVILSRARTVVETHPFPRKPAEKEITLFIAGHGTARHHASRKSVERQADIIRRRGTYSDVRAVFIEEAPGIADCFKLAATRPIVMVPFFLSDGLHVCEDIPVLLGESNRLVRERLQNGQPTWRNPSERHGKLVWCSASVGTDPVVIEVILERVREAARWPVGRAA